LVFDMLASVLRDSDRPTVRILEDLSGRKLHIEVLDHGHRLLSGAERQLLHAAGLALGWWRTGLLRTADGAVAASTSLVWLPARLPCEACRALDAGAEPAGVILGPLGMRREDRQAAVTAVPDEVTGQDPAVRCTAVLTVNRRPVAIAAQCVTREFAEGLAVAEIRRAQDPGRPGRGFLRTPTARRPGRPDGRAATSATASHKLAWQI
jgi:hypothetical protein